MSYTNSHRALLQAIMDRGAVSTADARELVVKLFEENRSTESYMNQINDKLETLSMSVEKIPCEVTGQHYWILVNTVLDDTARFQTEFSPAQLELLRRIFSEIITAVDCSVPSTVCLNLCSTLDNKMSKGDAENFLTDMVKKRWFVNRHGKFYMGVRSIAELIPYFRTTYTEDSLHTCILCRRVVFHGERCENCTEILHLLCFANCARVQNPPKCPSCGNVMETENIQDFEGYNDGTLNFTENINEASCSQVGERSSRISSSNKRKQRTG